MTHGNCPKHEFRDIADVVRSIGRVTVQLCNNCLSVVVLQKRDIDVESTQTRVEMKDSAYPYVR